MRICIFDLDKTLTDRASFTNFLIFAAWRIARWRVLMLAFWVVMLLGYKLGLCDRTELKRRGMALFIGPANYPVLERLGRDFAARWIAHIQPGARRLWDQAGEAGDVRVIATAAFALYAAPMGAMLGSNHVIATPFAADGHIPGGNNYGAVKLTRVTEWLAAQGYHRDDVRIAAYSDSFADAPLLDWADVGFFVTRNSAAAPRARQRGWQAVDLSL